MQSKSAALQEEINSLDQLIQNGVMPDGSRASDAYLNLLEMQRKDLQDQKQAALENEQAHESRVQEATSDITTRVDTLYLGGKTLREMCADEEAYQIVKISFTQDYISQATKNSEVLSQSQSDAQATIKQANDRTNGLEEQNSTLLQENHRLTIELADIEKRFEVATNLLKEAPSSEETDKLKQTIKELTAQLELKNKADEPIGDVKSQIDAMIQERENKKVKITNLRLADPSGINTKDYLATDVLTGLQISIHSNYVKSYKEVSAEEAEQIKAELEAQQAAIPVLEVPEIQPVNPVTETDEAAEEKPFQEVEAADNAGLQNDQGNSIMESVVSEESQVITLESLQAQVNAIKAHVGLAA